MTDKKHDIFVLGLDDANLETLTEVRGDMGCRFHPLLSVSLASGLIIFGEHARRSDWLLGTTTGGALLIGTATVLLARSPLLDPNVSPHTRSG